MNVLVTAASKHGATEGIAEAIAAALDEQGVSAHVAPIDKVEQLDQYEAVVLGSAVYMGRWLEHARKFVDAHADELAARPTWLFSSGPLGDPLRPVDADAVNIDELVARTNAREHRFFAGTLDKSKLGFAERAAVRAVHAPEGDYRDWDEIRSWAVRIAAALSAARAPVP